MQSYLGFEFSEQTAVGCQLQKQIDVFFVLEIPVHSQSVRVVYKALKLYLEVELPKHVGLP